jgi:hypothetical protein
VTGGSQDFTIGCRQTLVPDFEGRIEMTAASSFAFSK